MHLHYRKYVYMHLKQFKKVNDTQQSDSAHSVKILLTIFTANEKLE